MSNKHLLLPVHDEVATLIIAALASVVHNLLLAELGQVAELGADHDGDLADLDFVALPQKLLAHGGARAVSGRVALLELLYFHGDVDLSLVSQVPESGLVREDRFVLTIFLKIARKLVNSDIAEIDLVNGLFIMRTHKGALLLDVVHAELLDDLLHRVLEEALV